MDAAWKDYICDVSKQYHRGGDGAGLDREEQDKQDVARRYFKNKENGFQVLLYNLYYSVIGALAPSC